MPDDHGTRFVSDLLEDFADEWLTKCMFHYRWWYAPDRRFASLWVVGDRFAGAATMPAMNGAAHSGDPRADPGNADPGNPVSGPVTAGELDREIERFHDRQVSRMALVGVTEANRPLVEASYEMILTALRTVFSNSRFCLEAGLRWRILRGMASSGRWRWTRHQPA